jgi:phosphoribosyl-ATP pyrophosphohydrolase/phosphoribosyl-AMP cyclohydrolase
VSQLDFLTTLENVIQDRLDNTTGESYTARIEAEGAVKAAQKLGEEAVEVALAAVAETPARLTEEAADLLYHFLLLLRIRGLSLEDVLTELRRRHKTPTR